MRFSAAVARPLERRSPRETESRRSGDCRVVAAIGADLRGEAARQQDAANHQHARHRHLAGDDQRAHGGQRGRGRRRPTPALPSPSDRAISSRRTCSKRQDAAGRRVVISGQQQRERQHAPVDRDRIDAREIPRAAATARRACSADRQRETGDAAEHADDRILDQQLPRQPAGAGAERGANRRARDDARSLAPAACWRRWQSP